MVRILLATLFYYLSREYYNTLKESGQDLKKAELKASKQKDQIFAIYRHTLRPMTPAEIWENHYKHKDVPLTSIRRAITNLETAGLLKKTDIKKPGVYGKMNYCWIYEEKLDEPSDQLNLL